MTESPPPFCWILISVGRSYPCSRSLRARRLKIGNDRRRNDFVMSSNLFYLASLVIYTFGALTFCVFSVFYWGQYRRRRASRNRTVFPLFTLICGIAFLNN